MATSVSSAFDDFNNRITPNTGSWDKINQRKDAVVSMLKTAFPASDNMRFQSAKVIGSLGRNTASIPVDDIDLLVHLHVDSNLWSSRYVHDSSDFLYRVRKTLNNASTVEKVGARGQAVRLFYTDGLIVDVAAVEKYQSGAYAIPDGSRGWLTTNPDEHEAHLNRANAKLTGDLKKVIRFAKQWNKAHSSYLASFHLEMMVARTFATMDNNSRTALRLFFEYNINNLSVNDPAGYSGDLSSYLTYSARQSVTQNLRAALTRVEAALEAENNGNHAEAIRLWKVILGDKFPTFG